MTRCFPVLFSLVLTFGATLAQDTSVAPSIEEGPLKPALEAFQKGQHQEAIKIATPLAEEGDQDALFLLGFAAETGQGVEASREKALDYYQKAAKAGHQEASYRRALILLNSPIEADRQLGRESLEEAAKTDKGAASRILGEAWLRGLLSEKPDPDKALEWWTGAAEAGDSDSLILLARFRSGAFGYPDKVDAEEAIKLYRKAAENKDQRAFLPLGSMLLNGAESIRQPEEGRKWLNKGIELGMIDAYLALGDFEENVTKDDKAAFKTYLNGANAGQLECMLRTGIFFFNGKGVDASPTMGLEWLNKASTAGHPRAALELATLLSKEKEPNIAAIYSQLLIAAEGGLPQAMNELALFYLSGNFGAADKKAAAAWFTDAAKAGFAPAQHNLATLFEGGIGVAFNFANAGELYTLAANQGHAEAATALARMNAQGKGTEQNIPKAWALAKIGVDRGDEAAKELLTQIEALLSPESKSQADAIYKELTKDQPKDDE
ncbi:tetratricopeptide repeat protein [Haloferula sp.]|uniref:tetratricopeptide repeat protein n=1 Tax=Haloferula sp. TaxID=2497595 RepID=UPI003C72572B